jgi:hypothetical protein
LKTEALVRIVLINSLQVIKLSLRCFSSPSSASEAERERLRSSGPRAPENGGDGSSQNLNVQPQGPLVDVLHV